jgi:hypothetical protein
VIYVALVAALGLALRATNGNSLAITIVLTFGALHILYDGLIWRSPAPRPGPAPAPAPAPGPGPAS